MGTNCVATLSRAAVFDAFDEYDSGKPNGPFAPGELLRAVGVASDKAVSLKRVQRPAPFGVVEGQRLFVFQCRKTFAPFGYLRVVSDPNFAWLGVEFVPEAQGKDFVAFVEQIVSVGITLWIGAIG